MACAVHLCRFPVCVLLCQASLNLCVCVCVCSPTPGKPRACVCVCVLLHQASLSLCVCVCFYARQASCLCVYLCVLSYARQASCLDASKKLGLDFRLLHTLCCGVPWYGLWGYRFAQGGFAVTAPVYHWAIHALRSVPLRGLLWAYRCLDPVSHCIRVCIAREQPGSVQGDALISAAPHTPPAPFFGSALTLPWAAAQDVRCSGLSACPALSWLLLGVPSAAFVGPIRLFLKHCFLYH